jgi:hypothetical protein
MSFWGGVAGAVGGIVSTVLGNNSAKKEASKNREFQEEMSNTSISRRMADLRNAGLNPLLAVENASAGASTPSGSQAQLNKIDPSWITALSTAKLQAEQAKTQRAETKAIEVSTRAQEQENSIFDVKADKLRIEAELQRQGILTQKTMQELNRAGSLEAKSRILVNQAHEQGIRMSTEEAKRKIQLLDVDLKFYNDNPDAKSAEKGAEMFRNPSSALGAVVSTWGSAYQRWKSDRNKNKDKVRK